MERFVGYNEYKREQEQYQLDVERLIWAVEGDIREMTFGAVDMMRDFEKIQRAAETRKIDERDMQAAAHAAQAANIYREQIRGYVQDMLQDMNQFLQKYPNDFRVAGRGIEGAAPLRDLFTVGEDEHTLFAASIGEDGIVFTPGDYELLVKSSMIDTE